MQGLRRGRGLGLTHQSAEGQDAEQPLQEDAKTVHERAALAAARPGRDGGGRPARQSAARVPSGALHGGPGGGTRGAADRTASLPAGAALRTREPGVQAGSRYLHPAAPTALRVTRRLRLQRLIGSSRRGGGPLPLLHPPIQGRGSGRARGWGCGSQLQVRQAR